jgi:hypothetical protein
LFYSGKLNLALGKKPEGETLIHQAKEMGLKKWGAKSFRYEKLLKEIGLARVDAGRNAF